MFIYSIVMTCYLLFHFSSFIKLGRPPWMAGNQLDLADKVKNIELSFPEEAKNIDPHLRHLIKRMLDKDANMRIDLVNFIIILMHLLRMTSYYYDDVSKV